MEPFPPVIRLLILESRKLGGKEMKTVKVIWITALFIIAGAMAASAGSEINDLTFINKSGEPALVKLVGPSRRVVPVPDGQSRQVQIASGTYCIYVRYGDQGHYRYTRGETFIIQEVTGGYVAARLTLHGVVNGNYAVESSSEAEFDGI